MRGEVEMQTTGAAIIAFLDAVQSGEWRDMEVLYAPDAIFDGTVPEWHFTIQGAGTVIEELGRWFPATATLSDVRIEPTVHGAAIEFERRWNRAGEMDTPPEMVGVRQAHILKIVHGRIVEQRAHCSGIWDAATFATIEAEAPRL